MERASMEFSKFEYEGWQQVAAGFDTTWGGLTRLFVPHLLDAVDVGAADRVLDVACGPGYVAEAAHGLGAEVLGVDFSEEMVKIAASRVQAVDFREGDAQELPFAAGEFDVVVMNFGVLHMADPERAFREAHRVLRNHGRYGFTVWAGPEISPGAQLFERALEAHADLDVPLPQGPDYFAYADEQESRSTLAACGFDPSSFGFRTVTEAWQLADPTFLFKAERDHGVRSTALLRAQPKEVLDAIEKDMERGVRQYENEAGFALPYAAHVVTAAKRVV